MSDSRPSKVLSVGGGCAALEAAFHLQRVGAGRMVTTILAPDLGAIPRYAARPADVTEVRPPVTDA